MKGGDDHEGDHPRGCGEHGVPMATCTSCMGSSPRMRGALHPLGRLVDRIGIIPADAGSTASPLALMRSEWDHPRGCGEHPASMCRPRIRTGSSPRMRGALLRAQLHVDHGRIIPADAGSTVSYPVAYLRIQDHPRGCGEHSGGRTCDGDDGGSSPRMRGAQQPLRRQVLGSGIIPADAGSTPPARATACWCRDHPRGCGEHCSLVSNTRSTSGSSPRMRGALNMWKAKPDDERIIPADAGSTEYPRQSVPAHTDHPRGCGEHSVAMRTKPLLRGSSPRMRGALRPWACR